MEQNTVAKIYKIVVDGLLEKTYKKPVFNFSENTISGDTYKDLAERRFRRFMKIRSNKASGKIATDSLENLDNLVVDGYMRLHKAETANQLLEMIEIHNGRSLHVAHKSGFVVAYNDLSVKETLLNTYYKKFIEIDFVVPWEFSGVNYKNARLTFVYERAKITLPLAPYLNVFVCGKATSNKDTIQGAINDCIFRKR